MMKKALTLLLPMALMAAGVQTAPAQPATVPDGSPSGKWYVGVSGGPAFGQATFRSITESKTRWGTQFGVFGGHQFSRLLSVEALAAMGWQKQSALDCDPYWLSTDGERTFVPVMGKQGHYYRDLDARTRWLRLGLQANFDMLSLLTEPATRWSVTLSPQLSAVTTRSRHLATGYEQEYNRQWHLGLGGQAAVGYRVARSVGVQLYGGITCLTGQRFDNMPDHYHKSNFLWEAGLKLSYHFGRKSRPAAAEEPATVAEPSPQPVVAQKPAAAEEKPALVAEKAQPAAAKPAAPAAKPAAEPASAAGPLSTVYFANNSHRLTQREADKLNAVADRMKAQPDTELAIYGHASNTGSEAYNLRLTQRRANTVKMLLVRRGIAASRLHPVVGRGIDRQASSSKDARRVELIINDQK